MCKAFKSLNLKVKYFLFYTTSGFNFVYPSIVLSLKGCQRKTQGMSKAAARLSH